MSKELEKLLEDFDSAMLTTVDIYSEKFTEYINSKVEQWNKRFHRHKITAYKLQGLLCFDIESKLAIMDSSNNSMHIYDPLCLSGVLGELIQEQRDIVDKYNDTDIRRPIYYNN